MAILVRYWLPGLFLCWKVRMCHMLINSEIVLVREHMIMQMKDRKTCPVKVPSTIINGTQEGQDLWEDQNHPLDVGI